MPAVLAIVRARIVAPAERTEPSAERRQTASRLGASGALARSRLVALPLALLCVVGLGYVAGDVRQARLGFSLTHGLAQGSEVRRAADAAPLGFSAGIISPTEILLTGDGIGSQTAALGRAEAGCGASPGVSGVVGPAEQARAAAAPGARAGAPELAGGDRAAPFTAPDGKAVADAGRDSAPTRSRAARSRRSSTSQRACRRLLRDAGRARRTRRRWPARRRSPPRRCEQAKQDIVRLALVALAVNLLLLMLFLRALVAPVVLLGASVLALGAALGVAVLVSRLLGWGDVAYYTPLAAAVLLLSLGSDYNVFVVGRIWHEARTAPAGRCGRRSPCPPRRSR